MAPVILGRLQFAFTYDGDKKNKAGGDRFQYSLQGWRFLPDWRHCAAVGIFASSRRAGRRPEIPLRGRTGAKTGAAWPVHSAWAKVHKRHRPVPATATERQSICSIFAAWSGTSRTR